MNVHLKRVVDDPMVVPGSDASLLRLLAGFVTDCIHRAHFELSEEAFDVVEAVLEKDHEGMRGLVRDYFVRDLYRSPHALESYVWQMGPLTFAILKAVETES